MVSAPCLTRVLPFVTRLQSTMHSMLHPQELTLNCSDGVRLAAQAWSNQASTVLQQTPQSPATASNQNRVLCLHGWMDNSRSFHYLAPAIVEHFSNQTSRIDTAWNVVALDFPGHGLSSHKSLDGPPTLLADGIFYVSEAVHQLQWDNSEPFTLIGHSMGAAVACLYAAAFPEQIGKLVLLDGAGPFSRNGKDTAKHVRLHVLRRREGIKKQPRIYANLQQAIETRKQTATTFPGKQYLSDEAAREMVLRGTKAVDESGAVQFIHDPRLHWPSVQYFTIEQVEGLYQDIQCPTALLQGEDGWPFDDSAVQRVIEVLKPVLHKKLPGSHHLHADPDTAPRVAEEIIKFISNKS